MSALANHHVPQPDRLDSVRPTPLTIRSLTTRRASEVVARVRGEFDEMRGFSPTLDQAARLFGLSRDECVSVLGSLVQQGFLHCTSDGRYRLFPR